MRRSSLRQIFAGVLCLILALGVLSGCSKKESGNVDLVSGLPKAGGMLMVNYQAEVTVVYDKNGSVLFVEGYNSKGIEIAEKISDLKGGRCAAAVAEVLNLSINAYPDPDNRTIVVKQMTGSSDPTENFMKELKEITLESFQGYTVFAIPAADLDAHGYLDYETAEAILRSSLSLDRDLTLPETPSYIPEQHSFIVPMNGEYVEYCVNAYTGTVASLANLWLDTESGNCATESDVFPSYMENEIYYDDEI